jgi:hypothetical protein
MDSAISIWSLVLGPWSSVPCHEVLTSNPGSQKKNKKFLGFLFKSD